MGSTRVARSGSATHRRALPSPALSCANTWASKWRALARWSDRRRRATTTPRCGRGASMRPRPLREAGAVRARRARDPRARLPRLGAPAPRRAARSDPRWRAPRQAGDGASGGLELRQPRVLPADREPGLRAAVVGPRVVPRARGPPPPAAARLLRRRPEAASRRGPARACRARWACLRADGAAGQRRRRPRRAARAGDSPPVRDRDLRRSEEDPGRLACPALGLSARELPRARQLLRQLGRPG